MLYVHAAHTQRAPAPQWPALRPGWIEGIYHARPAVPARSAPRESAAFFRPPLLRRPSDTILDCKVFNTLQKGFTTCATRGRLHDVLANGTPPSSIPQTLRVFDRK